MKYGGKTSEKHPPRKVTDCISAQQTHDVQATLPFGHDLIMSPMTLHNGCDNVTSQRWVMTLRQRYDVTSSRRTLMVAKWSRFGTVTNDVAQRL